MADIDLTRKLLDLKKKIQEKENQKIKIQTQIEIATKTLKEKYGLSPDEVQDEIDRLEKDIEAKREKVKNGIKKIEDKYGIS